MLNTPLQSTSQRRGIRGFVIPACLLLIISLIWLRHTGRMSFHTTLDTLPHHSVEPDTNTSNVAMVVASQKDEDTSWLNTAFMDWKKHIYVTNDQDAELTVPANRGREGMVYLTYIIDNYESLPEVVIFHHANRYQWHNDDPLYDGERVLSRLQLPYVIEQGYVNLRCVWTLGCPTEIRPFVEHDPVGSHEDVQPKDARTGAYFKEAFEELFPEFAVPEAVGLSCCAQFAVTGKKIRERPRQDYERYREWLLTTHLRDDLSGRLVEYFWHIIFGQNAVYCPNAQDCYCKVFGLCDLECESKGVCRSQYTLPKISTMPKGWPDYDWNGNWQNASAM